MIIRSYKEEDFPSIQKLYSEEGWLTPINREDDAKEAFKHSLFLVAIIENNIVGILRAITDTQITTYIAELLVKKEYRGQQIASNLIHYCHELYPNTRLDVLASLESTTFYKKYEFKSYPGFRKSYK